MKANKGVDTVNKLWWPRARPRVLFKVTTRSPHLVLLRRRSQLWACLVGLGGLNVMWRTSARHAHIQRDFHLTNKGSGYDYAPAKSPLRQMRCLYLSWTASSAGWGLSGEISSLFLLCRLVTLGLGGDDVPLHDCPQPLPTITSGERGKGASFSVTGVISGSAQGDSTGSSDSATWPLDGSFSMSVCRDLGGAGLCPGEGTSDSGDVWDLLSLEKGLTALVTGSWSSSGRLSSSPAEPFPKASPVWLSLFVPLHSCLAQLSSPSSLSSSVDTRIISRKFELTVKILILFKYAYSNLVHPAVYWPGSLLQCLDLKSHHLPLHHLPLPPPLHSPLFFQIWNPENERFKVKLYIICFTWLRVYKWILLLIISSCLIKAGHFRCGEQKMTDVFIPLSPFSPVVSSFPVPLCLLVWWHIWRLHPQDGTQQPLCLTWVFEGVRNRRGPGQWLWRGTDKARKQKQKLSI